MSNNGDDGHNSASKIIGRIINTINPKVRVGTGLLEIIDPDGNGEEGSPVILGPSIDTSSCTGCERFTLIPKLDERLKRAVEPAGIIEVDEFDLGELACEGFFDKVEKFQEEIPPIKLELNLPAFPKAKAIIAALPSETSSGRIAKARKRSIHPEAIPLPDDLRQRRRKDREPLTEIRETEIAQDDKKRPPQVAAAIERSERRWLPRWREKSKILSSF